MELLTDHKDFCLIEFEHVAAKFLGLANCFEE